MPRIVGRSPGAPLKVDASKSLLVTELRRLTDASDRFLSNAELSTNDVRSEDDPRLRLAALSVQDFDDDRDRLPQLVIDTGVAERAATLALEMIAAGAAASLDAQGSNANATGLGALLRDLIVKAARVKGMATARKMSLRDDDVRVMREQLTRVEEFRTRLVLSTRIPDASSPVRAIDADVPSDLIKQVEAAKLVDRSTKQISRAIKAGIIARHEDGRVSRSEVIAKTPEIQSQLAVNKPTTSRTKRHEATPPPHKVDANSPPSKAPATPAKPAKRAQSSRK